MLASPTLLLLGLVGLGGCASASPSPDVPPVPVLFQLEDVPFECEMLGTVHRETEETLRTSSRYRSVVTPLLWPEGGLREPAVVLAEDFEDARTFTVRVRSSSSAASDQPEVTLEGWALRYVDPSCR